MTRPASPKSSASVQTADLLLVAAGIALFYGARVSALNSDSLLAWPITEKLLRPEFYGGNDLIINAGTSGNFLFYKLLAWLPFLNDNYPLRDFLLYLPVFLFTVTAWFLVFREISGNARVSSAALVLFMCSDGKLGLNWSNAPFPALISYTSVHFAQVFALFLFLRERHLLSFMVLGATGYFHPATALVYFSVLSAVLLLRSFRQRSLRSASPMLAFLALFIPNALMIARNAQGGFLVDERFWEVFRQFQYHVYLDDHFREGYAYTLSLIAILLALISRDTVRIEHRRTVFAFIGFSLLGCSLWLLNSYTLQNLQITHTFFIMRVFYLVKPLVILLTTVAAVQVSERAGNAVDAALPLAVILSLAAGSPALSTIIVLTWGISLINRPAGLAAAGAFTALYAGLIVRSYGPAALLPALSVGISTNRFVVLDVALICLAAAAAAALARRERGGHHDAVPLPFARFAAPVIVLLPLLVMAMTVVRRLDTASPFAFSPATAYGFRDTAPDYAALVSWARTQAGSTFIVPPYDQQFASFRYLTKCGVYIHENDINQLMYSPAYYLTGFSRLRELGLVIRGRRQLDWTGYNVRAAGRLRAIGAEYAVFDRRQYSGGSPQAPPVFMNDSYAVYRLSTL